MSTVARFRPMLAVFAPHHRGHICSGDITCFPQHFGGLQVWDFLWALREHILGVNSAVITLRVLDCPRTGVGPSDCFSSVSAAGTSAVCHSDSFFCHKSKFRPPRTNGTPSFFPHSMMVALQQPISSARYVAAPPQDCIFRRYSRLMSSGIALKSSQGIGRVALYVFIFPFISLFCAAVR